MRTRTWRTFFGAVLLMSAAPLVHGAGRPPAAQTSTTTTKKKSTSSKSRAKRNSKAKLNSQKAPTPDRIKEIQSALQRDGAYEGEPTGKWDDSTVDAMKKYQDKNGLSPTGKIDALTLQKLGLGSQTAGKGAPTPTASTSPTPSHSTQ